MISCAHRTPLAATALAWTMAAGPAVAQEAQWRTLTTARPAIGTWVTSVIPVRPERGPLTTASLSRAAAPTRPATAPGHEVEGIASFYWQDQMTASGERFDRRGLTAAHKTLPFGTRVRVTHAASGRSVVVRINDRGPFKHGRVIDLSEAAAETIGLVRTGLAPVRLEVVP